MEKMFNEAAFMRMGDRIIQANPMILEYKSYPDNEVEYMRMGDRIIQANPRILEDEYYPIVKEIYRDHYRRKRTNYPKIR